MFSLGIEPSITSTNGASSSSRTAWRKGSRNSSPPSVGDSTLLWRWTFGIPGIAPSSTSSIPGWPAAVTETESPSQLIPSEIHRMWTSSTPGGAIGSGAMTLSSCRCQLVVEHQGIDEQLLALQQLEVQARAGRAGQRERLELRRRPAGAAAPHGGDLLQHELRAVGRGPLRDEDEGEGERVRHDLAQVPDLDLHALDAPAPGVVARDPDERLRDRQLVHQQIL